MKKISAIVFLVVIICVTWITEKNAVFAQRRPIHLGLSVGFGLPKIPFSIYRSPVSILGSTSLNVRLHRKFGIQLNGGALHTFSIGTLDSRKSELRFNLQWGSIDLFYHLRGYFRNESFIFAGMGAYHESRLIEDNEQILNTAGLNLGLVNWTHMRGWTAVFEVRWHLLFKPDDMPQVISLSFGVQI